VKKEQNERESLRRLKPTVGCDASKRRRIQKLFHKGPVSVGFVLERIPQGQGFL
jgi:hypothetical protein